MLIAWVSSGLLVIKSLNKPSICLFKVSISFWIVVEACNKLSNLVVLSSNWVVKLSNLVLISLMVCC